MILKMFMTLLLFGSLFALGWVGNMYYHENLVGMSGIGNESDLFGYSRKLSNEVYGFWKWNMSNIGNDLTIEELKEEGGVCWHYADYYFNKIVNETDFYVKKVRIKSNETISHEFTVVSNEEGYCVLDQIRNWCFKFGDITNE